MTGGHRTLPLPGDALASLPAVRETAVSHAKYEYRRAKPPFRTRKSADLAVAVLAPCGQLVLGCGDRLAAVGALAGEVRDGPRQLAHRTADSDPEHALTALQKVDDLFGGCALVHRGAIGEQRDVGQILHTALTQMVDGNSDVLQGDSGVEQPLHDLENQDVLERIQPLRTRTGGTANRRHHKRCPRPVIQLPVGDARDL